MVGKPGVRITLAVAISLDGRIKDRHSAQRRDWISDEDKGFFRELVAQHSLVVAGRKTFQAMQPRMGAGRRWVVVTRHQEAYSNLHQPGRLEFTAESPDALIERLESEGATDILVVGGRGVYTGFLDTQRVSRILVTLEPIVIGAGRPFVDELAVRSRLRLESCEVLNQAGTLLLRYAVAQS